MYKRPISLFFCAILFLYFPAELLARYWRGQPLHFFDFVLDVFLPLVLLVGLVRVTKVGWYTLVALVALWGIEDLYQYYAVRTVSIVPLIVHIAIYCVSLAYFINPRVRHLYFDPRLRWWRTKPRYETHLPFLMAVADRWHYPILRNISEGGCFIETSEVLGVNSELDILIPLPVPLSVSAIRALGEVRWVSKNPLRRGVGVQFKKTSKEVTRSLGQYVARQL